jgi:hypothetical protein
MAHACGGNEARQRFEKILSRSAHRHLFLSAKPFSPKTRGPALIFVPIAKTNSIPEFVATATHQVVWLFDDRHRLKSGKRVVQPQFNCAREPSLTYRRPPNSVSPVKPAYRSFGRQNCNAKDSYGSQVVFRRSLRVAGAALCNVRLTYTHIRRNHAKNNRESRATGTARRQDRTRPHHGRRRPISG